MVLPLTDRDPCYDYYAPCYGIVSVPMVWEPRAHIPPWECLAYPEPRPHTQTAVRSAAYCALTVRPWESALLVLLVPVPGCPWTEMTSLAMMLKPEVASHEPVCLAPKINASQSAFAHTKSCGVSS